MIEPNHRRELILLAFALYLATSFAQLHAKSTWPTTSGFSLSKVESWLRWHIEEMGRAEESENALFAPGD